MRHCSNFTAKDGEDYVAIVDLPEGEHQYKFLIDDEWKFNPSEVIINLFVIVVFHYFLCLIYFMGHAIIFLPANYPNRGWHS